MSKSFGIVPLDDVYPLTDEYGNEFAQRDYSLKANQDYVAELAESMRAKGEPDEPITVIPDGGIYYVKVGRSRYEAMKMLGTRECHAVIDDEDSRQAAVEAIIRTDVKKKYEGLEKSRMVQQLQMFGDDQYVSEVAGITAEQSRKVRRARKAVDDAAEDMTLDRLCLIEEFADDPEAVEALSTCKESEAQWKAQDLRRKRAVREEREALAAALAERGVPVVEDVSGMSYFLSASDPAKVDDALPPEWEEGQVAARVIGTWNGARAEVYVSAELADASEDSEQADRRRLAESYREAIAAMDESRAAWFWARLAAGLPMPNLLRECESQFLDGYHVGEIEDSMTEEAWTAARNKGLSLFDYAMGFESLDQSGARFAGCLANGSVELYRRGDLRGYLDLIGLFQSDGWDAGDAAALIGGLNGLLEDGEGSEGEDE